LAEGKVNKILTEAQSALKGAGTFMDNLNANVTAAKIPDTVKKARLTLDDARGLLDKLKRTSETLDNLIERLYQRPPDLLFGKAPKGRFNEQPTKPSKAGR
jgi:hypothetical protein